MKKCKCGRSQPSLGVEQSKPIWCAQCPDRDGNARNVKAKKCQCGRSQPSLGLEEGKPIWCAQCPGRDGNARNVTDKKCACGIARPSLGLEEGKPIWCAQCPERDQNARNVTNKKCFYDWCQTSVSDRYEGYCLPCYANTFPDRPVSKNYKTKERLVAVAVKELMETEFPHLLTTYDRSVSGGCSRKKPDTFIDAYTHVVCGEVDEEQHNSSKYCSCENRRMMELMGDVAFRPIIFVRLNPDAFTDVMGVRHPSCFKITKAGNLSIRDKNAWDMRLATYLSRIRYHLETFPAQELQVEHLYYNGFAI
jgi:hypothetical protein